MAQRSREESLRIIQDFVNSSEGAANTAAPAPAQPAQQRMSREDSLRIIRDFVSSGNNQDSAASGGRSGSFAGEKAAAGFSGKFGQADSVQAKTDTRSSERAALEAQLNELNNLGFNATAKQQAEAQAKRAQIEKRLKEIDESSKPNKDISGLNAAQAKRFNELQEELASIKLPSFVPAGGPARELANRREEILAELDELDKAAGRDARSYDGLSRRTNWLKSWLNRTGASYTNAAGSVLDLGSSKRKSFRQQQEEADMARFAERNPEAAAEAQAAEERYRQSLRGARDSTYKAADTMLERSEGQLAKAKYGVSGAKSIAMDAGSTLLDIGVDRLGAAALGVPGLANMFARVYGSTAQDARLRGDDVETASLKGLKAATIEVVTEKIGGAFEGAYGKSLTSEALNAVRKKFGNVMNRLERSGVLRWVLDTVGEGGEEALADILNTTVDHMVGWDDGSMTTIEDILSQKDDILYDTFLGSLVGSLGASTNLISNRANARANAQNSAPVQTAQEARNVQGDISAPPTQENVGTGASARLNSDVQPDVDAQNAEGIKKAASKAANADITGDSRVANAEASRSTSETSGANSPAINAEDVQTADANAWRGTSETKNALSPAAEADASNTNIAPEAQNVDPNVPAQTVEESGGKKRSQTEAHTLQTIDERLDTPSAEREELYYTPKSESESLREAAERIREDMPGARAELAAKDMWSGADHDTAMGILGALNREAAQTGNYDDFRAWRRTIQEHGTDTARALQSLAKYTRTGTGAMMDAVDIIDSSNISGELKSALTAEVGRYSEEYDAARAKAENGNLADMADLIERMARRRNTWTFGKNRYSKIVRELASDKANAEWLADYAYRQISAIASDAAVKVPFSQKVKSAQTTAQLTSIGTFLRNIGGNVTFGVQDTLAQNGVALAIDRLISQATGKRTVGADKSWFSSEARKGARDAMQKSILEVAGDIDMGGSENRYGMTSSRSWRMSGNAAERFMSRWQQLLGYSLTTSDRFSRGAIEAEITRGLDALGNSGLTAEEKAAIAQQTADYRLFQNHGEAYTASKAIHDFLNVAGFGGTRNGATRQGGFGLGDVVNTYPGVPANLGVKALEYSPANVIKGGAEIIKVLKDAKNGELDAAKQHQAVMDVSRGVTGTAMVALMAALFKAGFIRNSDDEDDLDARARNAERGLSGVQINADAALDWLSGKPKREWRAGDTLISVDWMEPLNAFMAIGSLIANDTDADLGSYTTDYAEGAFQALMDIPVMSNLKSLDDTIRYSNSDNWSEALGEGLAEYGTNTATGFIPAPFRQIAKALDPYYRDTSADTAGEEALNKVKNAIPGLRQTLDPKLGTTGDPKKYNEGGLQHMLNSLFLPGSISTLGGSETDTELEKLYKATGMENIYQDRKAPKSVSLDGEKYELTNDEKRSYLRTQGQATERTLKNFMDSELYGMMTDKEKAQTIAAINEYAREEAKAELFKNRGIERESGNEGLSDVKNVGEYLGAKTAFTQAKKQNDYSAQDKFLKVYDQLTAGTKRMLENSSATARMDDMAEAYEKGGIRAKEWNTVYEKYKELNGTKRSGYTASDKATDFEAWMEREGFSKNQRKILTDQFTFFSQIPGDAGRYNSLKGAGFDTDSAYAIYDKVSSLTAPTGEKTVKDWQKLEAINSLDLTGEEKIKALSVYYPPNDDGKEDAMVRRYKAAEEQGISFATWTKAMKIIAGADGTSRKAIFAAVQEAGYTETDAQIIYDIWKHS